MESENTLSMLAVIEIVSHAEFQFSSPKDKMEMYDLTLRSIDEPCYLPVHCLETRVVELSYDVRMLLLCRSCSWCCCHDFSSPRDKMRCNFFESIETLFFNVFECFSVQILFVVLLSWMKNRQNINHIEICNELALERIRENLDDNDDDITRLKTSELKRCNEHMWCCLHSSVVLRVGISKSDCLRI